MVKMHIIGYNENNDTFTLRSACEHPFDDFAIPAILGAALTGMYDDPHEFIGLEVSVKLPELG